eukprot:1138135-Pelagomonas_calceolata.AAC.5
MHLCHHPDARQVNPSNTPPPTSTRTCTTARMPSRSNTCPLACLPCLLSRTIFFIMENSDLVRVRSTQPEAFSLKWGCALRAASSCCWAAYRARSAGSMAASSQRAVRW